MFTLQERVAKTASFTGADLQARSARKLLLVLDVFSAERDSANETYDIYVTSGVDNARWDIAHFPQIATTGAKRFVIPVNGDLLPQTVTTAGPGVAAVLTGSLKVDTAGSNEGIKTLTAGMARHGIIGEFIGHELVVAGTIGGTGIDYQISVYEL